MLAAMVKEPAMALDKREAKDLAKAIERVQVHYELPGLSPKHQAMMGLAVTAGRIYAPRAVILAAKMGRSGPGRPARAPSPPEAAAAAPSSAAAADPALDPWFMAMGAPAPVGGRGIN